MVPRATPQIDNLPAVCPHLNEISTVDYTWKRMCNHQGGQLHYTNGYRITATVPTTLASVCNGNESFQAREFDSPTAPRGSPLWVGSRRPFEPQFRVRVCTQLPIRVGGGMWVEVGLRDRIRHGLGSGSGFELHRHAWDLSQHFPCCAVPILPRAVLDQHGRPDCIRHRL